MTELTYFDKCAAEEIRACTRAYLKAVAEAHPELAIFLPDDEPPEIFDPYPPPSTIDEIAKWVAAKHRIPLQQLRGKNSKNRSVSTARNEAFYLCRKWLPSATLERIGAYFGDRDHSTVKSGISRHMELHGLPAPELQLAA